MDSEKDRRGTPPGAATLVPEHGRGRIGNPPFVPTDQQRADVKSWAKILSHEDIAKFMDISVHTLTRHFRRELDVGRVEANLALGSKLMTKAYNGNLTALIFYLRTRAKWNTRVELTGPNGGPMQHQHIDLSSFLEGKSEAELALLEPLIEQMLAAAGVDLSGDDEIGAGADQGEAG